MANPDHNKVALVTGAAQRIGAELVRCLHAAGYRVAIHYGNSANAADALAQELNEFRADSAVSFQADLLDIAAVPPLVDAAVQQWGRLDLLINNASSFYPTPLAEVTEAAWDDLIGTNLKAPLFLAQAAAPWLAKQGGNIVNIVDIHARTPLGKHPIYCAAKAGLAMLTKSLAKDLGPDIRVNGVAPGAILWPEHGMTAADQQKLLSRTALKRQGSPADIAAAALFLTKAEYVTGEIISIDGGRSLGW